MIPKRIHYCWFSQDPYPQIVQDCMTSWKQYMPDWEYVLWDYEKIKDIDSVWLKECLQAKKWAFAADFVRVWALYHEGGIYLDSDVMVYQSFSRFLSDRLFIGRDSSYPILDEGYQVFLTSHCFGSEAGHPFLKLNLAYYQDRHFITCTSEMVPAQLRHNMLMMPYIQCKLAETFGYDPVPLASETQELSEGMVVYPPTYFCWLPDTYEAQVEHYAWHIGQASWREPEYWATHKHKDPVTLSYKIRWRIVRMLSFLAEKLDYRMVRIHPDQRY